MSTPMYIWEALKHGTFYHSEGDDPFTGYDGTSICNYCGNSIQIRHKKSCPVGHVEEHIGRNSNRLATVTLLDGKEQTIISPKTIKSSTIVQIIWHRSPTISEYKQVAPLMESDCDQKTDYYNSGCLNK